MPKASPDAPSVVPLAEVEASALASCSLTSDCCSTRLSYWSNRSFTLVEPSPSAWLARASSSSARFVSSWSLMLEASAVRSLIVLDAASPSSTVPRATALSVSFADWIEDWEPCR